ncbi:MAG: hypothetical protein JWO66_1883 [Candidatus Eremiobacteraeota bacterium]|nr:hypothetical protein [Candidatus Eremiobacteraeota bacterium]
MSLSRIIDRRDAILASSEPVMDKLPRIDDLVRATAVLALLSNDKKVRHVFDDLLDLYISLSGQLIAPLSDGPPAIAFVNRQAVVHDRTRRTARSRARMFHTHLPTA